MHVYLSHLGRHLLFGFNDDLLSELTSNLVICRNDFAMIEYSNGLIQSNALSLGLAADFSRVGFRAFLVGTMKMDCPAFA